MGDDNYYYEYAKDPRKVLRTTFSSIGTDRTCVVKTRLTKAVEKARKEGKRHIVGWKKAHGYDPNDSISGAVIVELRVPVKAMMRCPRNTKCRASEAKVHAIYPIKITAKGNDRLGKPLSKEWGALSLYTERGYHVSYFKGKTVYPKHPFDAANKVCGSGIHFHLTKREALAY